MKDLLSSVVVVAKNLKIWKFHVVIWQTTSTNATKSACRTIIFPQLSNEIIVSWRCRCPVVLIHRRTQDFSKEGSHCVKVRVLTRLSGRHPRRVLDLKKVLKNGPFNYGQDIVMAFSPPVVGCLVKKGLQKGVSRAPQDTPWLRPCYLNFTR